MRKPAVSASDAEPARSTALLSATFSVASSSRPRTFDSKHEDGGEHSSWDKQAF